MSLLQDVIEEEKRKVDDKFSLFSTYTRILEVFETMNFKEFNLDEEKPSGIKLLTQFFTLKVHDKDYSGKNPRYSPPSYIIHRLWGNLVSNPEGYRDFCMRLTEKETSVIGRGVHCDLKSAAAIYCKERMVKIFDSDFTGLMRVADNTEIPVVLNLESDTTKRKTQPALIATPTKRFNYTREVSRPLLGTMKDVDNTEKAVVLIQESDSKQSVANTVHPKSVATTTSIKQVNFARGSSSSDVVCYICCELFHRKRVCRCKECRHFFCKSCSDVLDEDVVYSRFTSEWTCITCWKEKELRTQVDKS